MTATAPEQIRLRPLTLVQDADETLVGDPQTATFVSVPAVGAVVIRALQRGASPREAALEAEKHSGEPVDVESFVEALRELGFVRDSGDGCEENSDAVKVQRTAPIQQRRWVTGLNPRWAKPFFSPAAWAVYAATLLFSIGCFALHPALIPSPEDTFVLEDRGLSLLILLPLSYLTTALHEGWHWLGARAAGVAARFGIDRRLCFLVFETDLSQLWSLPRRQRLGPQLAGLAADSFILAGLLATQLAEEEGWISLAPVVTNLAAAMTFVVITGMIWQSMIFLRTDLYGALVTITGCHNLWEVKTLLLRRTAKRLSQTQREQLAAAHPRDIAIGRWFRWIYLMGIPLTLAYYAIFQVPVLIGAIAWSIQGIATGPAQGRFWLTLAESMAIYIPLLLVLITSVKARLDRIAARSSSHRPRGESHATV
ncbi:hypothetical protein ACF08O_31295 [Streptomyces paradoxus]|uniref:hypothetical protein n=1 Tax=Streptomyces paradoxus TaxID=66375 RepID=UPI0036F63C09